MKEALNILLLFLLMMPGAGAQHNFIPTKSLHQISEEHKLLKRFSWPNPDTSIVDSILHADFDQFDSLVNMAFLVKYDSLYDPRFYELINQLRVETEENILLQASFELSKYGYDALKVLDNVTDGTTGFLYWKHVVRTLVLGYEINDLITTVGHDYYTIDLSIKVGQRSFFNIYGLLDAEREHLQTSLGEFISSSGYAEHKHRFHQIVLDAYKKGVLHSDYTYAIIQRIIIQEVLNKEEAYLNDYLTIIDIVNEQDAFLLLEFVHYGIRDSYYPQLFLDLLDHENENIVRHIIEISSNCGDEYMCPKVKSKLLQIFNGHDDALKFKAAFALMHDYEYPAAYDYLMREVDLNRQDRRYTAISWLGDSSNWGHPMSDTLHSVLSKYLYDSDDRIKRATIQTYLKYNSPNVIESLIPFVDYELESIANSIINKLLTYEDKAYTREKLQAYLATGKGSEKHKLLLENLK